VRNFPGHQRAVLVAVSARFSMTIDTQSDCDRWTRGNHRDASDVRLDSDFDRWIRGNGCGRSDLRLQSDFALHHHL